MSNKLIPERERRPQNPEHARDAPGQNAPRTEIVREAPDQVTEGANAPAELTDTWVISVCCLQRGKSTDHTASDNAVDQSAPNRPEPFLTPSRLKSYPNDPDNDLYVRVGRAVVPKDILSEGIDCLQQELAATLQVHEASRHNVKLWQGEVRRLEAKRSDAQQEARRGRGLAQREQVRSQDLIEQIVRHKQFKARIKSEGQEIRSVACQELSSKGKAAGVRKGQSQEVQEEEPQAQEHVAELEVRAGEVEDRGETFRRESLESLGF